MLRKVSLVALRVLLLLTESPSMTRDVLCATLSCKQGGTRCLALSAVQAFAVVHGHSQEFEKLWSSPTQLSCESLSRNLSSVLESFQSHLENSTEQDCACQPGLDTVQQLVHRLAQSLAGPWLSAYPAVTFLSDFAASEGKCLVLQVCRIKTSAKFFTHICC
ncbi:ATP-binding cassette sub-family A member 13-like [Ochotona princeps]|uniref:ATP-binding cassette sub-family A member 13-like n=1 Tax=Ochotona princeps TaxID=9978 RepID=UPI0027147125|nr:ATP-binding cassette sub-family A member 13-like [Ochotona princeps]